MKNSGFNFPLSSSKVLKNVKWEFICEIWCLWIYFHFGCCCQFCFVFTFVLFVQRATVKMPTNINQLHHPLGPFFFFLLKRFKTYCSRAKCSALTLCFWNVPIVLITVFFVGPALSSWVHASEREITHDSAGSSGDVMTFLARMCVICGFPPGWVKKS